MKQSLLILLVTILFFACSEQEKIELKNNNFSLELATDQNGFPIIKKGYWLDSKKVAFVDKGLDNKLTQWLPADLIPDSLENSESTWKIAAGRGLSFAELERDVGDLKITWTIELFDGKSFFRTYVRLQNIKRKELVVEWFPIWTATWGLPSKVNSIETWEPLSYVPISKNLDKQKPITLFSNVYSSDSHETNSHVPFWQLESEKASVYCSLGWCGGWQADFIENEKGANFQIKLPPKETQLRLKPGESITGPQLYVFASAEKNKELARSQWLFAREFAASLLHRKPDNWTPFVYNHWYSCRFDLNGEYMQKQINAMQDYNFDVFVIDAGWYNKVGDWRPNKKKFKPGEFATSFRKLEQAGIKTGIWTCPWLQEVEDDNFSEDIEDPRFYRTFMNAYALDLVGTYFEKWVVEHIAFLKTQFPVDWWKYDQELFGESSRSGKMKNVIALEKGLSAVRNSFPKMNIENCMSGGRMINEFTDQIAQAHWIRDGGDNGLKHARSNIKEALGAARFLAPMKIQRWTNRPNELDENDTELFKMYCRSAMIGTWGISADLNKISEKQKSIILDEAKVYKKLAPYKQSMKYEILYPTDDSPVAGIVFYHITGDKAAVLLYRWNSKDVCEADVKLDLMKKGKYNITNWDTGETNIGNSADMKLNKDRMSAIYFVEAAQ